MRHFVGALLDEMAGQRRAGVIDEDADTGIVAQAVFNSGQIAGLGQVRRDHIDGDVMLAAQARSQCIQARLIAGDQHQIVAALRKAFGVDRADAGGGASDQNSRASAHGLSLFEGVRSRTRSACADARFSQRRLRLFRAR
ncbi:hypothetical protein D3C81_1774530 [compost metagenome]